MPYWITDNKWWISCSNCGVGFAKQLKIDSFFYCPNCGVKMSFTGDTNEQA